jgi:hypothetical protein
LIGVQDGDSRGKSETGRPRSSKATRRLTAASGKKSLAWKRAVVFKRDILVSRMIETAIFIVNKGSNLL